MNEVDIWHVGSRSPSSGDVDVGTLLEKGKRIGLLVVFGGVGVYGT